MEIRAVYFDWGGVLIDNPSPGIEAYFREFKKATIPEDLEIFTEGHMIAFQKGKIHESEFLEALEKSGFDRIPSSGAGSVWRHAFERIYREKPEIFQWIRRLRDQGILTGVLSNTEAPAVEMFHDKGYDCFDHLVFSCECGWVKPEAEIFQLAISRMGLTASEILFIDDKEENVRAARRAGMNAYCLRSSSDFFEWLPETRLPLVG